MCLLTPGALEDNKAHSVGYKRKNRHHYHYGVIGDRFVLDETLHYLNHSKHSQCNLEISAEFGNSNLFCCNRTNYHKAHPIYKRICKHIKTVGNQTHRTGIQSRRHLDYEERKVKTKHPPKRPTLFAVVASLCDSCFFFANEMRAKIKGFQLLNESVTLAIAVHFKHTVLQVKFHVLYT